MITNRSDKEALDRIRRVKESVAESTILCGRSPEDVTLMAVTKTVDPAIVNLAVEEGITLLGENRVQEYLSKRDSYLLDQASVHFIGHLQTNKVKQIIDKVDMIQSVSSVKLAQEIHKEASKINKTMDVLLEVNIGKEESKSGFEKETLAEALDILSGLSGIRIRGLMCIPPRENAEKFFYEMNQLFVDIRGKKLDNISMDFLSMGMSEDYPLAIRYGSNLVRLGSALFGPRSYAGIR